MTPSIDLFMKFLVHWGLRLIFFDKTNLELDKSTLRRLENISSLSDENKSFLFRMIDMALRDLKTRQAYANRYKMNIMDLQYIIDGRGHKSGVQLPIQDWEKIQKDLEELERLRNKKLFLSELAEAVEEMKLIREGKVKARNAEDFLNEL